MKRVDQSTANGSNTNHHARMTTVITISEIKLEVIEIEIVTRVKLPVATEGASWFPSGHVLLRPVLPRDTHTNVLHGGPA